MKTLLKKYGHIWAMGYGFIYLPWFLYLERTVVRDYAVMHVRLDDRIPFNEYFVIPYLLWFLYVAGTLVYFFFASKHEYYRLCTFLFTGMTVSLLVCTFFPNGTDLRVPVDSHKNFCSFLVSLVHTADTSTNVFPSIHVYNSIGVHLSVMHSEQLKEKKWIRRISFVLMVSIIASTMFLKQHSVFDVITACLTALVMYTLVYARDWQAGRRAEYERQYHEKRRYREI